MCRCGLMSVFDLLFLFNKITDFHFEFSFHFVFQNFFLEFECAACLFFSVINWAAVDFYTRNGRIFCLSVSLAYSRLSNFCRIL